MSGPEKCAGCDSTPAAECCYPGGYPELPIADVPDDTGRKMVDDAIHAHEWGPSSKHWPEHVGGGPVKAHLDAQATAIATLEREVERLRDALEVIANARTEHYTGDRSRGYEPFEEVRNIAHRALARALDAHPTQTEDET